MFLLTIFLNCNLFIFLFKKSSIKVKEKYSLLMMNQSEITLDPQITIYKKEE